MNAARELSRIALAPDWSLKTALTLQPEQIDAAIVEIESTRPLKEVEPRFDGPATKAIADALRPIGAKLAPTMNREQADAWRGAVILALSDLPARIALYGVQKAVHVPMLFPNEVDGVARRFADEALERQRNALHRLKMMRAEFERARNPQPTIEPPPPMVWTQESVDEANELFARVGIKSRYALTEEGVDLIPPQFDTSQKEA